ncbi:hypothetical protein NXW71_12275 [Parabacteroides merdae]|nr:hypothetical protein [Parabacteroides merdae]
MYFIFPDNLPVSVQKAAFEFTSGQFPLYRYITPDTEILNRGISIAIPDEASHIRSIRLTTSLSHFTYYYPEKGYKIAQGIHLPPFRVPAVGDLYANGVIIQAGADSPGQHIEPDIAPYKGSVMEIREQTLDYFDALIYCESISEGTLDNWHLPDMLNPGITAHQATGIQHVPRQVSRNFFIRRGILVQRQQRDRSGSSIQYGK